MSNSTAASGEDSGRSFYWRAFLYFAPWALVLVLTLGFYYRSHTRDEISSAEAASSAMVRNGATILTRLLQRSASDVLLLAADNRLEKYVESGRQASVAELTDAWIKFLRIQQTYDQIRYIDETGQERLRVNYNDGQPGVVAAPKLQSTLDRPFFNEASRLPKGDFYISQLDLTVEAKEVVLPYKPTIRYAVPVFDRKGHRRGVFVVNYLANDLLYRVQALSAASNAHLMLLNSQGFWLQGALPGDEWAFMFGRPTTLETRYPGTWERLLAKDSDRIVDRHGMWTWTTLYPRLETETNLSGALQRPAPQYSADGGDRQGSYFWKIAAHLPADRLADIEQRRLKEFLIAVTAGLVLLLLAARRMAQARHNQYVAEQNLRTLNQTLEAQVTERTRRLQNEIFDRQMAERRYRESSEQYQHMVATTVDGYWLLDDRGGFLDANQAACDMLGLSRDALLSMTLADLTPIGSKDELEKRLADLMLAGSERFEARLRRLDGSTIDVEISASYLPDFLRFIAFIRDISERKRNEQERQLAAMVMRNADEAIFVVSADGYVMSANPAFSKITGIAETVVVGEQVDRLGLGSVDGKQAFSRLLAGQAGWRAELRGRRKTGEVYPVWLSATAVRDKSGAIINYVCVFSDITEIKESQARLDFLAHHDTLTGLPNRLLFRARLEHSLERAGRSKNQIAVMFIDLDHFKEVNDSMGHAVGDQLLIDLGNAMAACLRAEDTLARLGGDEFVVLLEQVVGHDSVDTVLEKFRKVYPWAMVGDGRRIDVTASIGVAIYPDNASDADALVMTADAAMYRAKEAGRNQAIYA